ncbi:hypothetical protein AKJ50_02435 [candidate division MSBL1 archaeon SCGC-AAA382A13]|uniref:Uncharacterized protein n=1 Tax=candidate division MSBL1 archaeon SCGC-AAA382A13 TaxID=1698279 RepID=A0A133VDD5_9EURY|nr:hypothetical protein AKJ50_02435 [candidate division MSBL1 archaeon SCGC-AAA382A13]
MGQGESQSMNIPRLFNVFDIPETKSIRAVSSLRPDISLESIWNKVSRARKVRTSGKDVVKFEEGKGQYLLLFPSGYVQIYAPNEEKIRSTLKSFRDELYEAGLLK